MGLAAAATRLARKLVRAWQLALLKPSVQLAAQLKPETAAPRRRLHNATRPLAWVL